MIPLHLEIEHALSFPLLCLPCSSLLHLFPQGFLTSALHLLPACLSLCLLLYLPSCLSLTYLLVFCLPVLQLPVPCLPPVFPKGKVSTQEARKEQWLA